MIVAVDRKAKFYYLDKAKLFSWSSILNSYWADYYVKTFITSKLANANPAEKKSLAIFSELKQMRSTFPKKSKFETEQ